MSKAHFKTKQRIGTILPSSLIPKMPNCEVIALIIQSKNGKKNIELQFCEANECYVFEELRFGDYCYEMFDSKDALLFDEVLDRIDEIMSGSISVIVANDLKKKRWIGDACFDKNDSDDCFGIAGLEKTIRSLQRPKTLLSKLIGSKKQYEIYDWYSYQCIVK